MVRWLASTVETWSARIVSDPRTGEIPNGSRIFHNLLELMQYWYFTVATWLDPCLRDSVPDSLMGQLLEWVATRNRSHDRPPARP